MEIPSKRLETSRDLEAKKAQLLFYRDWAVRFLHLDILVFLLIFVLLSFQSDQPSANNAELLTLVLFQYIGLLVLLAISHPFVLFIIPLSIHYHFEQIRNFYVMNSCSAEFLCYLSKIWMVIEILLIIFLLAFLVHFTRFLWNHYRPLEKK